MYSALLVLQLLFGLAVTGLILLQHGKGADVGAAFGAGASGTLFGARGSASFLSRATAGLAIAFFVNSMLLAYLASHTVEPASVVERVGAPAPAGAVEPALPAPAPAEPAQPADVPQVPPSGG